MVGDGPPGILTQPSPFRRSFIDVNGGFGPKGDYCGLGRRELGSYERDLKYCDRLWCCCQRLKRVSATNQISRSFEEGSAFLIGLSRPI